MSRRSDLKIPFHEIRWYHSNSLMTKVRCFHLSVFVLHICTNYWHLLYYSYDKLLGTSLKLFILQYSPLLVTDVSTAIVHKFPGTVLFFVEGHNAILLSNSWRVPSLQGPIAPSCLFDPPTAASAPCPPPPPPPPGPPPVFAEEDSQGQAGGTAAQHSALFAQLNQGLDITKGERTFPLSGLVLRNLRLQDCRSAIFLPVHHFPSYCSSVGLKHISDDQKTHKNPNLRTQAAPTKTKSPGTVNSSKAAVQRKNPLLELEGKKWRVVGEIFTPSFRDYSQRRIVFFVSSCSLPMMMCVLVVTGALWAETWPGDWGDGAQTGGLRLQLQQLHLADQRQS